MTPVVRRSTPTAERQVKPAPESAGAVAPAATDPAKQALARQMAEARRAVDDTAQALGAAQDARDAHERRVAELRAEVARLEVLLREARPHLAAAEAASVKAQQEYDRAAQAHQRAVERLGRLGESPPGE